MLNNVSHTFPSFRNAAAACASEFTLRGKFVVLGPVKNHVRRRGGGESASEQK